MSRKIDLISMEMLPGHGAPVAGGGLRTWSLLETLRAAGHDVRVCLPQALIDQYGLTQYSAFQPAAMQAFLDASPAEVFVFEQWYPLSLPERVDRPVVVDLPGPLLLENYWRRVAATERMALAKLRALGRADVWLYATPRQRYYWLAFMALSGHDLAAPALVHAPIAFPAQPASGRERDPSRFVYAGVFWPWQDPTPALSALVSVLERRGRGTLEIFGGPHPQHEVEGQRYLDPTATLPPGPRVQYRGMLPFEQLTERLETAGVAVDVVPCNAERELSSTIRTVVYLHCGLPVVVSRHSYLVEAIAAAGAGWIVDDAPGGLEPVFEAVLNDADEVTRRGDAARRLAQARFTCPGAMLEFLAVVDRLEVGRRPEPFTERLDRQVRELEHGLRERIGQLEATAAAQAGEIAHLGRLAADREASLHAARLCRQALEEAYYIASRDLEALRSSLPHRLLRALKRLLGKYREPDDYRPRIPEAWSRPPSHTDT
ncbi:hypothetical protein HS125_07225 [bacterium]|nr:hypothetical protein [bacterium]